MRNGDETQFKKIMSILRGCSRLKDKRGRHCFVAFYDDDSLSNLLLFWIKIETNLIALYKEFIKFQLICFVEFHRCHRECELNAWSWDSNPWLQQRFRWSRDLRSLDVFWDFESLDQSSCGNISLRHLKWEEGKLSINQRHWCFLNSHPLFTVKLDLFPHNFLFFFNFHFNPTHEFTDVRVKWINFSIAAMVDGSERRRNYSFEFEKLRWWISEVKSATATGFDLFKKPAQKVRFDAMSTSFLTVKTQFNKSTVETSSSFGVASNCSPIKSRMKCSPAQICAFEKFLIN